MIRFFKSPQPAALIVIPFIIIILWLRTGLHCQPVTDPSNLPVWKAIAGMLSHLPSWLNFIILAIIVSVQAVYFNLMINKHEVLYKNSYLPSLIFALLISSTPGLMQLHPVHFINLFVLIIFDRIFSLFKNDHPNSALFDAAFVTGLAGLFYFPALLLFVVLIISMSIIRPFNFREWMILFIGFLIPFFLISTYMFWTKRLIPFWKDYISLFPKTKPSWEIVTSTPSLVLAITISSLLFFSLIKLKANFSKNIIRTRSYQQIFFLFMLLGGASIAITKQIAIIHFAILALPISLFVSYFFLSAKKRLQLFEFALWILIGIVVWNQF